MTGRKLSDETRRLVRKVVEIIGRSRADRVILERSVPVASGFVARARKARASGRYGAVTKKHRIRAAKIVDALRRVEQELHDPNLPRPPGFKDEDLQEWLNFYKKQETTPPLPPTARAFNPAKHEAAKWAAKLLLKHDPEHDLPLTINGPYNRLAALLYGEEDANLLHVCKVVREEIRRKGSARKVAVTS